MLNNDDQAICRYILDQWARWLLSPGGFSHRSSSDRWKEQVSPGNSGFGSSIPHGVEPGLVARNASLAMRELREMDGRAVAIIEAVYLRRKGQTMTQAADGIGMTLSGLNAKRRRAEAVFFGIYRSRN